jgi:hypothetical protein
MADIPDLPLQQMPEIVSRALYGTTGPVKTPEPTEPQPFGFIAKTTEPPIDSDDPDFDLESERPPFAKLLAPAVGLAAFAGGPTYRPEPQQFPGEVDPEEQELADAIRPIRRLFAEGVFREALASSATPEPTPQQLTKRETTITPTTPTKTPELEMKFTRKYRQGGDGDIWVDTFDNVGELRSTYVLWDEDELTKARLELSKYAPLRCLAVRIPKMNQSTKASCRR